MYQQKYLLNNAIIATRLLQETMLAFKSMENQSEKVLEDERTVDVLADGLIDLIIDSSLRSHPGIRTVYETAIRESSTGTNERRRQVNGLISQQQELDKVRTPPPSPPRSPAPIPNESNTSSRRMS